jgi:hypothetical protein
MSNGERNRRIQILMLDYDDVRERERKNRTEYSSLVTCAILTRNILPRCSRSLHITDLSRNYLSSIIFYNNYMKNKSRILIDKNVINDQLSFFFLLRGDRKKIIFYGFDSFKFNVSYE